ncbi:MAG: DUF6810 family protein [Dehalococcoidia bacterium]
MRRLSLVAFAIIAVAAFACGSEGVAEDGFEGSLIVNPDSTYVLDDLTGAGYKKPKLIELEDKPNVQEAWFGFFDQKNVEVVFYASQKDAIEHGIPFAKEIVGAERDMSVGGQTRFVAYAVAGNVLLMCEFPEDTCENLIAQLGSGN